MSINKIDRRILNELQANGRITYSELADKVGLTVTPCIERVRRLEREGYIRQYTALVDPALLDAELVVFVQIRLDRNSRDSFSKFSEAVKKLKPVQECYLVTGSFDFLIKARMSGMKAYRDFLEHDLLSIPGVIESTTIVAMEAIKESLMIPV